MKITLFFGSFNPVHIGHLIIAQHILNFTNQQEVWLVCTPHNPDKAKNTLLCAQDRLEMLHLATQNHPHLRPCDIEFYLPKPSYTAHTLVHCKEKFPQHEFSILMGEDNLQTLHKWENYLYIVENFSIFVYPRYSGVKKFEENPLAEKVIYLKDLPLFHLSASFVRNCVKEKKSIRYLVTEAVEKFIEKKGLYTK